MLKKATFLALSLIALGAQATLITQSSPLVLETTEIGQSFTFNKFDASLGTLNSVSIELTTRAVSTLTMRNSAAQGQRIGYTSSLNFFLDGPGGFSQALTTPLFAVAPSIVAAGATVTFGPVDLTNSATYAGSLLDFSGLGTVLLSCETLISNTTAGGGGNLTITQASQAGCGVSVVYDYTAPPPPVVPEPGSLALVGLALAGVGLSACRRAK